tara:strand:+ start:905 stop:1312 length:408 start_codon:yes stop_codon:yes gene_type:complete
MDRLNTLRTVERPSSPNTALAAPDAVSIDAEVDRAVPVFDLSVEHLFEKAVSVWSDQKRVTCEYADTENQVAGFVAKTPFFGFKDDVYVEAVPVGETQSSVILYSKSRVGYSDLGKNRKRVDQWLDLLSAHVENA